jgi:hydroxypyruvate reductase
MAGTKNREAAPLRKRALDAFQVGVEAADPAIALRNTLDTNSLPSIEQGGQYIVISVGKAACKMAQCAISLLPKGIKFNALAVTNFENVVPVEDCHVMGASHPVPCEKGLQAAREVIFRLEKATKEDVVIMLVSGGASALLPAPVEEVGLHDKIRLNEILLASGFDIYQMNLVRQAVSQLKGGGVLRFAQPARVHSYILSDVLGDDLAVVGSGPSIAPLGTIADARRLLINEGVFTKLPSRIRLYLEDGPTPRITPQNTNAHLIAGNTNSVLAMAKAADAIVIREPLVGDVQVAAKQIIAAIKAVKQKPPFAIAFGGETTVKLGGSGKGGRNQELALRFAIEAETALLDHPWCFLSGGTDGIDGPTDAAGGLVDNETLDRLQKAGGNAAGFLERNDSYHALKTTDDLIVTGATGTNVADLQLVLIG